MPGSRFRLAARIPVKDSELDTVQQRLHDCITSVLSSPTLDSEVVTAPTAAGSTEQTITFNHQLGRVPTGLHIVTSSFLVASSGKQTFSRTQATLNVVLSNAGGPGTITAVLF